MMDEVAALTVTILKEFQRKGVEKDLSMAAASRIITSMCANYLFTDEEFAVVVEALWFEFKSLRELKLKLDAKSDKV